MRIIGGKLRGRKLISPSGREVRPTSDMAKQGIFNVLQFDIEGSRFVDLFSGSGAIGIEALSRGAAEVVFCDNGREGITLTNANLKSLKELNGANYRLVARDWRDCLRSLKGKWNYIFCDPPYGSVDIAEIAAAVARADLLEEDGCLIFEHDSDEKCAVPDGFELAKSRKYGRITVDYFVRAAKICALTGSFDPFTTGHRMLAEEAARRYGKVVVVVAINEAKQGLFSLKERAEIAKLSTEDMPDVTVEICSGMVWKFCKERGIKTIVRGWRDADDLAYERDMADFNRDHGVETVLIEAKDKFADIHSHTVRELLERGEAIDGYVVPAAAQKIKDIYERTRRKV